jgi:predicted nucleic acid-binding protein
MKFAQLASGSSVFVDANVFVYAFAPDPQFGPDCRQLLERIENHDLDGVTSTHILSDVTHRLMSLEACVTFGWPYAGIAQRLNRHPAEVQKLTRFRQALDAIIAIGIDVLPTRAVHAVGAAQISQQYGLLTNDALVLALMSERAVTNLASFDTDFDRVPVLARFDST